MKEQPLDLRESLAILRRRWKTLAVVALIGLCGGFAYGFLQASQPRATALVLLPASTGSSTSASATDMPSQVIIATSAAVLGPVAKSLSIPFAHLQREVSVTAASGNVLRIAVRAPRAAEAVQAANAVAKQYMGYTKSKAAVGGPTYVIQPGTLAVVSSPTSRGLKTGLIGLAVGLLLGTIVVLVRSRRDHRLRRRDQIAAAIGIPVLASLEAESCVSVADWSRLLERFETSAAAAWTLRRVLRNLVPADFEGELSIRVISFAGDKAALAAGPQLALFAAASGLPTRLAPDDDGALDMLVTACAAIRSSNYSGPLLTFGTKEETWYSPTRRSARWDDDATVTETQLVVSVSAVDRAQPQLTTFVGPTILSVSSGFPIVEDLARVALASTRSGLGIDGIVVVNPDPNDGTVGLVPDRDPGSWRGHESPGQENSGSRAIGWPR